MKRKALFLDRDGVINEDLSYVGQQDRFVFKEGLFDFLRHAQDCGYLLVIVTNQSGVARGYYTEEDYNRLTQWMLGQLRAQSISIALALACFTHPAADLPAYRRDSFWRKPSAGMILEATLRLNIDLSQSVMLGDQDRDMQAAQAAGVTRCLLLGQQTSKVSDVRCVHDFGQAAALL